MLDYLLNRLMSYRNSLFYSGSCLGGRRCGDCKSINGAVVNAVNGRCKVGISAVAMLSDIQSGDFLFGGNAYADGLLKDEPDEH